MNSIQLPVSVAISGSRSIKSLNSECIARINKIIELNYQIRMGDAPGIDTLVQSYLHSVNYPSVQVWHIGNKPRNNIGNWHTVEVSGNYTDRDRSMHRYCKFGLAIWDGRSRGTKRNIEQLGNRMRVVLIQ
ncbi:hypothetical protein PCC9214_05451 (plasmid) [Planktothrix tepida]|uniref:Uncharacterized protein n=1 Tax=Planktothrix tepida PCC 9214 TaxID=671072 RepID=A0A1J1LPK2_9CYAN|nr:hypothetical protein [Planktothrix tepida]CAD5988734.1 hypothetical protein PCC9214_05451 [Planktothrix tepida]CUR33946.1 conserved hypothetical protein [Planktothrix tepida PCC 9214]